MTKKKLTIMIAAICVIALAGWGVLMATIFRDKEPKDTAGKATPTPEEEQVVWLLTGIKRYVQGVPEDYYHLSYDAEGKCISVLNRHIYPMDGWVATNRSITYEYVDGEPIVHVVEEQPQYDTKKEYDYRASGLKKSEKLYTRNEGADEYELNEVHEYNAEGNPTYQASMKDGRITYAVRITYDEYEHIVSREQYNRTADEGDDAITPDKWKLVESSDADSRGRVLKAYDVDPDTGKKELNREVEYHADGSRKETVYPLVPGTMNETYDIFSYDTNTFTILNFDSNNVLTDAVYSGGAKEKWEYLTTDRGSVVSDVITWGDGTERCTTWEYDSNDFVMHVTATEESGIVEEIVYTREYNEKGQLVKQTLDNITWQGSLTVERQYDDNGNLSAIKDGLYLYEYEYIPLVMTSSEIQKKAAFFSLTDKLLDDAVQECQGYSDKKPKNTDSLRFLN